MVAKATHRKAVPVYEARGFRSGETVGALVALARKALWDDEGLSPYLKDLLDAIDCSSSTL